MSLFYLLQHYSKENAEIYKAQKESAKNAPEKTGAPAKTASSQKKGKNQAQNQGFAIPGQKSDVIPEAVKEVNTPAAGTSQANRPVSSYSNVPKASDTPASYQGKAMDFGETVVLSESISQDTVVLENNTPEDRKSTRLNSSHT